MFAFRNLRTGVYALVAALAVGTTSTGCKTTRPIPIDGAPREFNKMSLPEYVIEPPDILEIDLFNAVPKSPYRVQPLDSLSLRVDDTFLNEPISGVYPVSPEGTVVLGYKYPAVKVSGLTLEEVKTKMEKELSKLIKKPTTEVSLAQARAVQQVRGPHLVRPDGTIGLGSYGSVRVVGMTLPNAKKRIEEHLSANFENPELSLEIIGYNSKVYYMIYDGASAGQQVVRLPITGNETVLDAVSQMSGLPVVADQKQIWISRPSTDTCPCQTLPVDWKAITECADTRTNYQLIPGDRIFVKAYAATTADVKMARVLAPIERVLGVTLLGVSTGRAFNNFSNNNNNGNINP